MYLSEIKMSKLLQRLMFFGALLLGVLPTFALESAEKMSSTGCTPIKANQSGWWLELDVKILVAARPKTIQNLSARFPVLARFDGVTPESIS